MDIKYKSLLSSEIQKLVNKIETYSGLEIGFKEHEIKNKKSEKIEMQVAISNHSVEIRYDPRYAVEANSILHELLHVERSWLQKAPQLRASNIRNMSIAQMIDSQFEHLIIVPEEYKYGFNPLVFWEGKAKKFLEKGFDKSEMLLSRKARLLYAYMQSIRFGYNNNIKNDLTKFITKNGYLDEILVISKEVLNKLDDKIGSIYRIIKYLEISENEVYFEIQLVKERMSNNVGLK